MLEGVGDALERFRNGRREADTYHIFRVLENRLSMSMLGMTRNTEDMKLLLQDLENIAYKRVAERFGSFRDDYIFLRPSKTRTTRVRYDFKAAVAEIVRTDERLKDFLLNVMLLEMCEECNRDPTRFWMSLRDELDETCKGVH